MNEDDKLPDEIMALLPEQVSIGWEGINPCEAYHSGFIYCGSLNWEEQLVIYTGYKEKQDIIIPEGIKNILSVDRKKTYKCARTAFILGVKECLISQEWVL